MIKIYRTENSKIGEEHAFEPGSWIQLTDPSLDEMEMISERFEIDIADVRAAMDADESSRVDIEDDYTLILVDIPIIEIRNEQKAYTAIPLGILLLDDYIITICAEETPVLQYFVNSTVREFSTKKQMRFVYQILYRTCMVYQLYLRTIDSKRTEIEERAQEDVKEEDLVTLHELESNLVYFATSLRANGAVIDRLSRYSRVRQFPEDKDLLDDVKVENGQAIEMTIIYRDIIHGTRELLSNIIDIRLNNVMKYLAAITIVMAIPNIISGFYGMNVDARWVPLQSIPFGFSIICVGTVLLCLIVLKVLKKKKMI
ncbi:MAG: magnesium transporter CorA family protein [Lachnospiraceae bacterium]|nr:magnesium transporter CorA family protein [Lachnospiraceae bacterium]